MSENKRTIIEYLAPSLVVGVLFMIILAVNGLWPFGKETIDYYDMAQWSDLFYYHNYDELHGVKSFVYDWYINLGREIPGLSEPSLFDLLLYLVPRTYILECSSLLMAVKIMAAAFFMGIFIRYINKDLPYPYRLILSAGYGLCGFVLVNYTVPQWLDMAALVPLVLMYAQRSLKTGKFAGLSVTIFLIMIIDYYFAIQMLMFVFLTGGAYSVYLLISERKKDKKEQLHFTRLVLGVVMGVGLSALSWLGDIAFNLNSARFDNGTGEGGLTANYLSMLENVQPAYLSRWFALLGLAFPAAIVAMGLFEGLKKKKYGVVIFRLICIFMVTAQLFIESIHLLLHFGSYVDYPVRNGFMIYCIMAGIAAVSYDRISTDNEVNIRSILIITAMGVISLIAVLSFRAWYIGHHITDHDVLLLTMGIMVVCMAGHIILIWSGKGKWGRYSIPLWMTEVLIFGTIMIGKPLYDTPYGHDPEQEGEYIRITDQLVETFGDKLASGAAADTLRVKNPDTSLNANYGLVMRRETLSGWTNLALTGQIDGAVSLGYSSQFTRLLDSGGNIFSDTILHVVDVISHKELDDKLYEKVATADVMIDHMTGERCDYYLYKNRFEMPFAIPVTDVTKIGTDASDPVEIINSYAAAMGWDGGIASYIEADPRISSENDHEITEYNINVKGSKALYFKGNCVDTDYYNTRLYVNNKAIGIPSIHENDNELFPAHFNNNTVELGSFDDEQVSVRIDMDVSDPDRKYSFCIYEIDRAALSELCDGMPDTISVTLGRRSMTVSSNDPDGKYRGFLIPVSYSSGWTAYVNGNRSDIQNVNGLFMYVPSAGADTVINMSYFPPMMKTGIIIAGIMAVCLAAICFMDKKRYRSTGTIDKILVRIYATAFLSVFVIIYIIPIVFVIVF